MPAVSVQCPHCAQSYSVDGSLVGRTARCKGCGIPFALTPSGEVEGPGSDSSSDSPSDPPPGSWSQPAAQPDTIGRFVVKERLGSGAFGTVYRAKDPTLDRDVALKVPHPDFQRDERAVARFLREARAAARLRHPHIVTVFEAGSDDDTSYIASAFIPGRSLAESIDDGPFDPRRAARIIGALADALHHAHEQGIVHRDVKPANVLLDREDRPHLTDFGLARLAASSVKLTKANSILGTPAYLSPEQAAGKSDEAEPASDQYSLGVALYELLCGRVPFAGPLEVVIFHTLHSPPPPLRAERPEVPAELEAICLRAMAKKPEDRYASCRELAKDLGRWLAGRRTSLEVPAGAAGTAVAHGTAAPAPGPPSLPITIVEEPIRTGPPSLPTGRRPPPRRRIIAATAAAAALLLTMLGVVIYVATDSGTVKIELSDPKSEAVVKLDGKAITVDGLGAPLRLRVGEHELVVVGEGFEAWGRKFAIKRGQAVVMTVELMPKKKPDERPVAVKPHEDPPPPPDETEKTASAGSGRTPVAPATAPFTPEEASEAREASPPGMIELYTRGDPLKQGWKMYGYGSIQEETDNSGVLVTRGGMGLLCYAERPFQDFILRLEYRVSSPQDHSGIYFHIPRLPITPADAARDADELQIFDSGFGDKATGAIYRRKAPDRPFPRSGEWNELELHVEAGEVRVSINRHLINKYQGPVNGPEYIGLQNMMREDGSRADSVVRFRNIRIEPLTPADSKAVERDNPVVKDAPTGIVSRSFFNGKDLTGWEGLKGYWRVRDGAIVGSCPPGRPAHTFLCSARTYTDFELRFKARLLGGKGNSGVQVRSWIADRKAFRVRGPQCEIAGLGQHLPPGSLGTEPNGPEIPADRTRAEGVYKPDDFNEFMIRCVGKHATIVVNGITTVDADFPTMPFDGRIAWQIHGKDTPREVAFKDITLIDLSRPAEGDGFQSLFNGKDLTGWFVDSGQGNTWRVEGGNLVIRGTTDWHNFGYLLSDRSFSDFVLRFEFQLSRGANSGVALRANPGEKLDGPSLPLEVSLLDAPPGHVEETGVLFWAILGRPDIPLPLDRPSNLKPVGRWNAMEIELRGGSIRISINDRQVLATDLHTLAKMPNAKPSLMRASGRIGFQAHTGTVRIRNVRIKPL